ncbi:sarcosine oxidase subunit beta [Bradyrhizobium diazoefficiens]|uniref:NAD(P)/FAD-dependent oxidoreductase n=1 Tax=Bradyrhizobium diazoefficiens TaxID=1355477 RepID=UPI0035133668
MTTEAFDVAVVGGGLHGLSAALQIARRGARVVVLERRWVGSHSSGASAAGVRTQGRDLADLPLSLQSSTMWHEIESIVGDDCGFRACGQVKVAESDAELAVLQQRVDMLRGRGYFHEEIIGAEELRQLVPGIASHCVGAAIVRTDGAADPHRTIAAFRCAAEAAGVSIREQSGVSSIERCDGIWRVSFGGQNLETPKIVNAAGAWAADVAAMIGDRFELGTKASMMIVTERVSDASWPVVGAVGRMLSFKQTDCGTLLIGGGAQGRYDLAAEQTTINFVALGAVARAVAELFPCCRNIRVVRTWSGLEAKTEDHLPVIGASPNADGVYHVFGFSGHGFQLVPAAGAAVADLVFDGATNRPIAGLGPSRLIKENAAA